MHEGFLKLEPFVDTVFVDGAPSMREPVVQLAGAYDPELQGDVDIIYASALVFPQATAEDAHLQHVDVSLVPDRTADESLKHRSVPRRWRIPAAHLQHRLTLPISRTGDNVDEQLRKYILNLGFGLSELDEVRNDPRLFRMLGYVCPNDAIIVTSSFTRGAVMLFDGMVADLIGEYAKNTRALSEGFDAHVQSKHCWAVPLGSTPESNRTPNDTYTRLLLHAKRDIDLSRTLADYPNILR